MRILQILNCNDKGLINAERKGRLCYGTLKRLEKKENTNSKCNCHVFFLLLENKFVLTI